jgi:hypothetical protein
VTVLLDDHLLRDWMVGPDEALRRAVGHQDLATTNLWYARLCRSAAGSTRGALLGDWTPEERAAIVGSLVALPAQFAVIPMRDLAWAMAMVAAQNTGLSTLGSEAVAAADALDATILVSARDDGPGIRRCCLSRGIRYRALMR